MERRRFLALTGALTTTTLAGCAGDEATDTDSGNVDTTSGGGGDTTPATEATQTPPPTTTAAPETTQSGGALKLLTHDTYEKEYTQGVKGEAKNVSGSVLGYGEIKVVFLDSEGTQVGESLDNVTDLKAGRTWAFDCPYLGSDWSTVANYEIEASDSPF